MFSEPQMTGMPVGAQAEKAIRHTLRNISERPGVAWYLGFGTQTYALLTEAYATMHGLTMAEAQEKWPPANQPKSDDGQINQCPFCGSHSVSGGESDDPDIHYMTCFDCKAQGPRVDEFNYDTKQDAIEASVRKWNERQMPR